MAYHYNLGQRFEEVVEKYSSNIALKYGDGSSVTYESLNGMANRLARHLLGLGVRQCDVVCIACDKTPLTFSCMIACLKLGAIYTILDYESPIERINKIIDRCRPKAIIVDETSSAVLSQVNTENGTVMINTSDPNVQERLSRYDSAVLSETAMVHGASPAYLRFTAGSTGFPKGAIMSHENVLNLIAWAVDTFNITPRDLHTNVNPLYFDNSVFDFYSTLYSGACLAPFSRGLVAQPELLVKTIDELGCTSWFSVPSMLIYLDTVKVLNKDNFTKIKRIIFGGEGYPKSKLKRLFDCYSNRVDLYNVYGPTECTCICSVYKIDKGDFSDLQGFPPLGTIIRNFSYIILDENERIVTDNQIGELCLLGPNVGLGYYNEPQRTQANFVPNPNNNMYRETMYRTGDLVKYDPSDRKIYIYGRKDNQIKHMGYRIELEEIETALSCLGYVSQAAVVHGIRRGLSQIVAILSVNGIRDENRVRSDLKRYLPHYMIPTIYHFMDGELPKNQNGKVDRKMLQEKYAAGDPAGEQLTAEKRGIGSSSNE
jgi:D-alanine--poly(phosphoribitol) ligase subunit 1